MAKIQEGKITRFAGFLGFAAFTLYIAFKLAQTTSILEGRTIAILLACLMLAVLGSFDTKVAVVATVLTFVFLALIRRILPTVNPNADPAAIGPFIVALPLAFRGLQSGTHVSVRVYLVWLAVTIPIAGLSVGIAGAANLIVPILAAACISSNEDYLESFVRTLLASAPLSFAYGISQYFHILSWDDQWLQGTNIRFSAGVPGTSSFRPFATFPAPGTGALVAGIVIVIAASPVGRKQGTLVRTGAAVVAIPYLALTQVRSVWLAVAVALIVLAVSGGRASVRRTIIVVASGFVLLQVPTVNRVLTPRLNTLQNPTNDQSYRDRAQLVSRIPTLISPVGGGLGSASSASRASHDQSLDNGYVVVLAETGVVGITLLGWFLVVLARRAPPSSYAFIALLIVINLAGFAFGNVSGLALFALIGIPRQLPPSAYPSAGAEGRMIERAG